MVCCLGTKILIFILLVRLSMNFKYKSYLQKLFSIIPRGERLNYISKKYVTHTIPISKDTFIQKIHEAFNHYNNFKTFNRLDKLEKLKYYEFGAGWELAIPLAMTYLKFEVFAIDIRKLVSFELVQDSIDNFNKYKNLLPFEVYQKKQVNDLHDLEARFGLHYAAPADARSTVFSSNYFDLTTSTATLEHIPSNDILTILNECYRILKKGGIMCMTTDYRDHWSFHDNSISIYNFLKYSQREWKTS